MSIANLNQTGGRVAREALPKKEYDAVVHAIIDLGSHVKYFKGEAKPAASMIKFLFEVPEAEEDGSSRIMGYKEVKSSNHELSALMALLQTLFGTSSVDETRNKLGAPGEETLNAFKSLLGKAVKLKLGTFVNKEGHEIQYVSSIEALDPRLPQPEGTEEPFMFTIGSEDAVDIYKNKLSRYTQDRIASAVDASKFPPELQQAIAEVMEDREDDVENKVLG